MFKKVLNFFDKFEDHVRGHLSRYPILYTLIGGVAIVLFWRGVWHTADILQARGGWLGFIFYEPINLVLVFALLLATGLFVSYFIGDSILISGLRKEKKLHEKTEKDIRDEEATLNDIKQVMNELKHEVDEIKNAVEDEHAVHHPERKGGDEK
jgi:low affinity Fe/Cu permease